MSEYKKTVNQNSEYVSIHEGEKVHMIECPKDFLDYFNAVLDFKENSVQELAYAINNRLDLTPVETADEKQWFSYSDEELEDMFSQQENYNQNTVAKTSNITPSTFLQKAKLTHPVRPVFLELFDFSLRQFIQYAYDLQPDEEKRTVLDIEHDYKTAKNNFAQLIKDTLYTDNSITAPKNIDLAKYDLKEPKKLSDNQLIYGKLFIEAADLYRCLRMYWLAIVKESPSVAELLEILLADAVKFGYSHCRLKYIEQEVKMITG